MLVSVSSTKLLFMQEKISQENSGQVGADRDTSSLAPVALSQSSVMQQGSRLFLSLVVFSNVWVSGAIASLVLFVQITLDLPLDWRPGAFIFAAALIPYNLDRVIDTVVQKIPDRQAQNYFRQSGPPLILAAASLTVGILLYQANSDVRMASLVG
ncbi:hypothetical protein C7271_25455, partial [filamentous cyanobacterium CCP5]